MKEERQTRARAHVADDCSEREGWVTKINKKKDKFGWGRGAAEYVQRLLGLVRVHITNAIIRTMTMVSRSQPMRRQ